MKIARSLLRSETQSIISSLIHEGFFLITNVEKDSLEHAIVLPNTITRFFSASISDTSNFAFYADSSFYIYKNSSIYKANFLEFKDTCVPVGTDNIIYFPETGLIGSTVVVCNPDRYKSSYFFLNLYDVFKKKSRLLNIQYPDKYQNKKLGAPKIFYSVIGNYVVISFGFDEDVYVYNINDNSYRKYRCAVKDVDVYYPSNADKKAKLEAKQFNYLHKDRYGKAFYDTLNNEIYRLYYPALPEKNGQDFLTYSDKACSILRLTIKDNSLIEYKLPNGNFPVSNLWNCVYKDNPYFVYNSITKSPRNEKIYSYILYYIKPYSF